MGRPSRIDIRRNDQVKILAGKDVKEVGRVLRVIRGKQRVVVEGINMVKRHTRPNPSRNLKGGIVEREGPIHISNVMVVCGACGQPTRIGHQVLADGKKIRICRKCEASLDR